MNEVVSSHLIVQRRYSFRQMLEIHQVFKQMNGTIFLASKQKVVDASSLTKLVSFLLTVEPHTALKIIIEGTNPKIELENVYKILTNEHNYCGKGQLIESSDTI